MSVCDREEAARPSVLTLLCSSFWMVVSLICWEKVWEALIRSAHLNKILLFPRQAPTLRSSRPPPSSVRNTVFTGLKHSYHRITTGEWIYGVNTYRRNINEYWMNDMNNMNIQFPSQSQDKLWTKEWLCKSKPVNLKVWRALWLYLVHIKSVSLHLIKV